MPQITINLECLACAEILLEWLQGHRAELNDVLSDALAMSSGSISYHQIGPNSIKLEKERGEMSEESYHPNNSPRSALRRLYYITHDEKKLSGEKVSLLAFLEQIRIDARKEKVRYSLDALLGIDATVEKVKAWFVEAAEDLLKKQHYTTLKARSQELLDKVREDSAYSHGFKMGYGSAIADCKKLLDEAAEDFPTRRTFVDDQSNLGITLA